VDHRSCAHPSGKPESAVSAYACQRQTTLDNHNKIFTVSKRILYICIAKDNIVTLPIVMLEI